ncbi:LacI family DNA-binding transcriptional regulator [Streptomyces sp. NPDC102402]|uniref:LacI family DNA-binding transcriptional regulator n=1 Tax=Streptomyces sp. NPDC102402 TaxID=3366169 RepID=UPI0038062FC8
MPDERAKRRVTLREVARAAGVSTATVTRTLQHSPRVEEATRNRVLAAVEELGYTPNPMAQGLRDGRRDGAVGLVTSGFTNVFQAGVAAGAERELRRAGLQMIIASTDEDPGREPEVVRALIDRRVSALLVMPDSDERDHLAPDRTFGTPVVMVGRPAGGLSADLVTTDDDAAVQEATKRLIGLGHRRIAALAGLRATFPARRRLEGFHRSLAGAAIEDEPHLVVSDLATSEQARTALRTLLRTPDPPTAVLGLNLGISTGILLERLAGATPFAFIGFDETEVSAGLGISAIVRDPQDVGRQAARLAVARLTEPALPPQTLTLPSRLVARGSGEIPVDELAPGTKR